MLAAAQRSPATGSSSAAKSPIPVSATTHAGWAVGEKLDAGQDAIASRYGQARSRIEASNRQSPLAAAGETALSAVAVRMAGSRSTPKAGSRRH
jgi:hypothetical protein